MISPEQNKRAMENLIARANEITGKNDRDITNAVNGLIEGYGGGGSAPILEELVATANGEYTPSGDGFSKATVAVPETPEWDGSFTKTRNLTGTTWEFASGWQTEANQGRYDILGEITDVDGHTTIAINSLHLGWFAPASGTPSPQANSIAVTSADDGVPYSLSNSSGFTLKITGGTDASHPDLVRWVESDGKLQ